MGFRYVPETDPHRMKMGGAIFVHKLLIMICSPIFTYGTELSIRILSTRRKRVSEYRLIHIKCKYDLWINVISVIP